MQSEIDRALFAHIMSQGRRNRIKPLGAIRQAPLSFAQQRIWFMSQLNPASAEYVIPVALSLRGALDYTALKSSLTALADRHTGLRTRFVDDGAGTKQLIDSPSSVYLKTIDLSADGELSARKKKAWDVIWEGASSSFDLESDPLLQTTVIRLGEDHNILFMRAHHIVADAWSFGVLSRELKVLYEGFRAGRVVVLPELAVQYADFAVWQREWLQGEVLDEQLSYWARQLDGLSPLELPSDRPRPAVRSGHGASLDFEVPADLSAALKDLFVRRGVTPFMGFLSVFDPGDQNRVIMVGLLIL